VKLQPGQIRSSYQEAVKSYFQELKLRCGQYKIDFIEADIARGFDQILSSYLVKRTKMK
jgi:hypothetical protein